jgi:hypothetical protein
MDELNNVMTAILVILMPVALIVEIFTMQHVVLLHEKL